MTKDESLKKDVAGLLPILRGLLAKPSDSEDDPYLRVILKRVAGDKSAPVSRVPALAVEDVSGSPEELRERLRGLLDRFVERHGAPPETVSLPGEVVYEAHSEKLTDREPLGNRVALVTGAAGAIGSGICRGLLAKGCRVAATDLHRDNLGSLVEELKTVAGERITGILLDVTDRDSVARGFGQAAETWGGVDIVVVNAGIALVSELMEMDIETFRKIERVNVEGTLLTLAEAGRWMRRQGTGGDIVLISTKNVFCPGAQFGAYSATKAASHQLGRIASLEFAPLGIRVNMVAPDAVFSGGGRRSGLWQEVGPSRMQARGLDEKGLEEYYRNRNLLKVRVTAEHVANAVLFFATRQTPTTGATIPVDGGLPDSTPR